MQQQVEITFRIILIASVLVAYSARRAPVKNIFEQALIVWYKSRCRLVTKDDGRLDQEFNTDLN